jgi:hypothetical protein
MIGADIEPADIVTHDEKDIRSLLRGLGVSPTAATDNNAIMVKASGRTSN